MMIGDYAMKDWIERNYGREALKNYNDEQIGFADPPEKVFNSEEEREAYDDEGREFMKKIKAKYIKPKPPEPLAIGPKVYLHTLPGFELLYHKYYIEQLENNEYRICGAQGRMKIQNSGFINLWQTNDKQKCVRAKDIFEKVFSKEELMIIDEVKPELETRIKIDDIKLIEKLLKQNVPYDEIYKFIKICDSLKTMV
jgi:hypothetical protein